MDLVETETPKTSAPLQPEQDSATTQKAPENLSRFVGRHIGPNDEEIQAMLGEVGFQDLDEFIDATVPGDIRLTTPLDLPAGKSEEEALAELRKLSEQNKVVRSYLGAGYSDCVVPPVIQRNVLENPGWYTAYTPYQAEIAQGRLEALLNFQTMITDLTGLDIANASLLDEATAAGGSDAPLPGGGERARHFSGRGQLSSADDRGRANPRETVRHSSCRERSRCVRFQRQSLWCAFAISDDRRSDR
jgi:glycine dehydrogenase